MHFVEHPDTTRLDTDARLLKDVEVAPQRFARHCVCTLTLEELALAQVQLVARAKPLEPPTRRNEVPFEPGGLGEPPRLFAHNLGVDVHAHGLVRA